MAGVFLDSFDHYATANLLEKWTAGNLSTFSTTITIASGGRNSTSGLKVTWADVNAFVNVRKTVAPSGSTVIFGFALNASTLSATSKANQLVSVWDGSTVQFCVKINSDGTLTLVRGSFNTGTDLGTTSAGISTGAFYYIEVKVVLATGATGSYEIRVNNTTVLTGSSVQTANSGTTNWSVLRMFSDATVNHLATGNWIVDDLYLLDGSTGVNNDFLGDGRCMMELPNTGNGANAAWTPSTGTDHGALVDENPPNTSDYNSSNTAGQRDTYVYPALGVTGTVKMVQTCLYTKKSDAGARTIAPVHRISGVNYDGAAVSPSTSVGYLLQVYDQSPATAAAWTVSEIDGAETGIKLVS